MSTEVFEDRIELQIGLIEAELPNLVNPGRHRSSYPLPALTPTAKKDQREFRTVVLENAFLKVTILPDLGGRIHSIFDKRTSKEILPTSTVLTPKAGGPRGAHLPTGILFGAQDRPTSLGSMDFLLPPIAEDEDPGIAILGELGATGLSMHITFALPPNRAEIQVEVKTFNRTFSPLPFNGGLTVAWAGQASKTGTGFALTDAAADAALGVFPIGETPMDAAQNRDGSFHLTRFPASAASTLSPRQLDTWTLRLVPFSGLGGLSALTEEAATYLEGTSLKVQTAEQRKAHKLLLLTADGQTLEAPADLYPETLTEIDLPSPATGLVIQGPAKTEILRYESTAPLKSFTTWEPILPPDAAPFLKPSLPPELSLATSVEALRRAIQNPATRATAHTLLGIHHLKAKAFNEAANAFEHALLFNAEDHLTWWLKALAHRLAGEVEGEQAEILNAHYLAPLEPALRAEGFLGLPETHGKDPNPLLAPLEDQPEAFVEVAALLLECGLYDQATRWIDESLRHVDLAMLRYLQAFAFLTASRMKVEAAEQVAAAARLPEGPPYPHRPIELAALRALTETFPNDHRLTTLTKLAQVLSGPLFSAGGG